MSPILKFRATLAVCAALLGAAGANAQSARLANLSTRGLAESGANVMVSGFIVGAGAGETVLIRGVGPSLGAAPFNISGVLPDPVLTLYNSSGTEITSNSAWSATNAAVMSTVGAFPLLSGSKDDAIVTTLPPGTYTAEVAGASGDTGQAMVEVYEVTPNSASSTLMNLSTRLFVGTGANVATSGFVISAGSGARTLLIRGVGPGLAQFGVSGYLADPAMTVLNSSGATVASNDNWGTPVGSGATTAAQLTAAFTQAGAFSLATGSLDSALVTTVTPGNYTVQVSGNSGGTGVAMLEVYDITPVSSASGTVSIQATSPSANTSGASGVFTVTRTGGTAQALVVNYTVSGTAVAGMDYQSLSGVVTIPAGSSTATITVTPNSSLSASTTTVVVTLTPSTSYTVGTASDTVTISNIPPTLYVANLAPAAGANSLASGVATILLAANGSSATINITFSNLSSEEAAPHLTIGGTGQSNNFVFNLDYPGTVVNQVWTFTAAPPYSSAQLLQALQSGNIYVEIGSADYPTGELVGQFVEVQGSETFTPPAPPPAINLSNPSETDAARFLAQATYGVTQSDINTVMSEGYSQWITDQMALPETSQLAATRADAAEFPNTGQYPVTANNRQAGWWMVSVTAPDQLRQRVAFALSQIFVVSDVASSLAEEPQALANYYDLLANDAFGNFRQLLQDVTLSPVMGNYLNMLMNAAANPAKGTSADENYAREVMQLFSIGLNFLNPDGTLQLDSSGQPIPTYNNNTIVQCANVYTGWSYYSTLTNPSFTGVAPDWYNPMMLYPADHDNTQKTVISETATGPAVVIPANEGGAADLNTMLNTLFNHQNTGPFICRELIQRLVSSNPSPGYVYRVAQVFANDGTGTRGNLAAVIRAILLDYEARSDSFIGNAGYGKLKEPLIRQTGFFRSFSATSADNRFPIYTPDQTLGQAALRSPTVFNFFLPSFEPPGDLASAGLYAPEFQITTASISVTTANQYYSAVYTSATPSATTVVLNLSALTSATSNQAMLNTINLLCCAGNMSSATQQQILTSLASLPSSTTALQKAQFALELAITSADGAIQQ